MIFIYDILLNWTDTKKIYAFYEWEENDDIEHIRKIPLFLVSSNMISSFLKYKMQVSPMFLQKIVDKTELYNKKKKETLKFATLLTDGKRTLAIEFSADGYAIYRSFLLLDEEEETLALSRKLKEETFSYVKGSSFHLKMDTTRRDDQIYRFLKFELQHIYHKKDTKKLKFLYEEYFNKKEEDFKKMYYALKKNISLKPSVIDRKLYELMRLSNVQKNN